MCRFQLIKGDGLSVTINQDGVELVSVRNDLKWSIIGWLERLANCIMANKDMRASSSILTDVWSTRCVM